MRRHATLRNITTPVSTKNRLLQSTLKSGIPSGVSPLFSVVLRCSPFSVASVPQSSSMTRNHALATCAPSTFCPKRRRHRERALSTARAISNFPALPPSRSFAVSLLRSYTLPHGSISLSFRHPFSLLLPRLPHTMHTRVHARRHHDGVRTTGTY